MTARRPTTKARVPLTPADSRRVVARYGRSPRTLAIPLVARELYGTPTWAQARRALVGASEMAVVLGVSPYASPFSLWWAKKLGWETDPTEGMRIGLALEPVVGRLFGQRRADLVVCRAKAALWVDSFHPWLGCSPDFLAVTSYADGWAPVVEPVEVKTDEGGHGWGKPGTADVPRHHALQVYQQCHVFGAARGHLVRLAGKRLTVYELPFAEAQRADMVVHASRAKDFLDSLAGDDPPDIDGHDATTRALLRLQSDMVDDAPDVTLPQDLADAYLSAVRASREAKRAKKAAENRVRQALGSAAWGRHPVSGARVVQRRVYKNPGYEVAPFMVDALYPAQSRKDSSNDE